MDTTHIYNVIRIADELLKIGKGRDETMSPMKLNKMAYIAQGWFLAMHGRKLFRNRIEAWKYGPVIPDLYRATKHHGREGVPLDKIGEPDDVQVAPEVRKFLESVYGRYGGLNCLA